MGFCGPSSSVLLPALLLLCTLHQTSAFELETNQTVSLLVDASPQSGRVIPEALFGVFFEEINHAGAGGLWAELSFITTSTDRSSCFERNKISLRMEVICDKDGANTCPDDGVGSIILNIEQGKAYRVVLHVRSSGSVNISVSLTGSDGLQKLASSNIIEEASDISDWKKIELTLESQGTNHNSRLQLTTTKRNNLVRSSISHAGHGFRKDLFEMLAELKPRFIRFPGGCFVEGEWMRNAFRWRETIGPWEERPGHFGDVWMYWTDDGLGYLEFLQLAEDLGAAPIWVFNNGISHNDQVSTSVVLPFVRDVLDSIEFARGPSNSTWGSVRAAMGHPEPFDLRYVAIGNEDCGKKNYLGNYLKFYSLIKAAYPDIQIISNCDGSSHPLDHPADMYDFHIYTSANNMFSMAHQFDHTSRVGPKAFVSEYAVTGKDAGTGSLLAALAEAGFLIGLETNSDVVEMASYAPLLVNANDRRWNPDAIVFNSWQSFGTPSYWMQQFFKESSGATVFPVKVQSNSATSLIASAIKWQSAEGNDNYLKIKVVNFGSDPLNLSVSVNGLENSINSLRSTKVVLTSANVMDENSFSAPNKVFPEKTRLESAGTDMAMVAPAHSISSFDLSLAPLVSSW
ncbi:unnamed protein product [Spirodela intermedia]|uniref:non-reducing end alpha-L-arabinofuranosidase n=1 Tax=Spirodela intermedia TaxID=51605 RepID=A0A7I8IAS7_SPIIN|nr:unnamed protein product [Spirodela intermedia]CAA6654453.1 unnamed protein product [Spirodela intermedia]